MLLFLAIQKNQKRLRRFNHGYEFLHENESLKSEI